MRSALAIFALAALTAASPMPGGVSSAVAPSSSPPAGCSENYSGSFEIQVVNVTSSGKKRDTTLTISLSNGVLTDSDGRTGYIAANQQFQFDDPPQAGAIYTAGFSVCANGSLAIGGDAIWYKCLSGTFYNLYDASEGGQCSPIYIDVVPSSGSSPATTPATVAATTTVVAESTDGQVTATPVPPPAECSEYVDGQPQCTTAVPECSEYVDGQPQCSSATPTPECSEYVDGQPQCSSAAATPTPECSEYVDGQPQCSSAAAATPTPECSEYVDGQPQCSSAAAVTTTAAECSEYVDGQPQCSSATPTPACSEYVDGQPQCGITTAAVVPSYGTGTAVAPASSYTGPAITSIGAGPMMTAQAGAFGLAAGLFALVVL